MIFDRRYVEYHGPRPIMIEPVELVMVDGEPFVRREEHPATLAVGPDETWYPGKPPEVYEMIDDDPGVDDDQDAEVPL